VVDAERGEVRLRPEQAVAVAYRQRLDLRSARAAEFARLKDTPAVTRDGAPITLLLNAGLALDVHHLDEVGAEGIGLFRTEFQFMVSDTLPKLDSQRLLYRDVLEHAGARPVTFRTLDLGGDKVLPYVEAEREANPALGWRAIRIGLDRPVLLRRQLRALIRAAEGRLLRIMFPLITTIEEFVEARSWVDRELEWREQMGGALPRQLQVGVMLEAPALAWAIPHLKGQADFISIGTNDLMQYFFAADRGNPRVADRYDILSPPALNFLNMVRQQAGAAGLQLSICGEAAGRPLEALAFIALGFRRLSMPAPGIGAIKKMVLSLDATAAAAALSRALQQPAASVRGDLLEFARLHDVAL
jgi:phosphotransferase system enzyme I (PtsP)